MASTEKLASRRAVEKRPYAPGPAGHWLLGSMQEFRADSVGFLLGASKTYGDLVHFRLGPAHAHLVNSAELARAVLVDRADEFHRSALTKSVFGRVMGDGLLVSDGAFHHRQRRLSQPAFVSRRVEAYAPTIADLVERQIAGWSDGRELVIDHEMETLSLAVVAKTLFGADLAEQATRVTAAMRVLQEEMRSLFRSVVVLPPWLPIPQNIRLRRAVRDVDAILHEAIRARRASGRDEGDLLSMLLAAVDPDGEGTMGDAQLRDEAITLFLAGFETVANGLTWLWYALATNPEVERELHAELDANGAPGRSAAADAQPTLPYAEMVVKETLRLFSPIWAFNRAPTSDIELGGWKIRRGEIVVISPPVLHMNPKYYDEPARFWPSRFGRDAGRPAPRGAYLPFGAGPHVCIGAQLATLEMSIVVATIARRFRVELVPGQTVERATLVTMCPKEPIRARLQRRGHDTRAS